MMYRYGYPHMFGFGFEGIFMIIFWALIIWAIFALVRSLTGHESYHSNWHMMHRDKMDRDKGMMDRNRPYMDQDSDAMRIVKERYAKGEINKEEFEQKKSDLMNR